MAGQGLFGLLNVELDIPVVINVASVAFDAARGNRFHGIEQRNAQARHGRRSRGHSVAVKDHRGDVCAGHHRGRLDRFLPKERVGLDGMEIHSVAGVHEEIELFVTVLAAQMKGKLGGGCAGVELRVETGSRKQ